MKHGAWAGQQLREHMSAELQQKGIGACTVEGEAASCVFEFAGGSPSPLNPDDLVVAQCQALDFAKSCFAQRLLVHHSGPYLTRVVLLPPLTVSQVDLVEMVARLKQALHATTQANCR
jgi:acetylornithine/succinyldiaminopimelate/putrescine aminotransferase